VKKLLTIILLTGTPLLSIACDICGCGVGGSYIGILPDFNKHIVGLRYRYNSLLTHLGTGGAHTYLTSRETYMTTEAWGGWNITHKLRIMATVPYNVNERENQGETKAKTGLGDISVLAFYEVINRQSTIGNKLLIQSLWAGAGVKLPSGKYSPADKTLNTQSANLFQLGTGSTDATVNIMYDARLQDLGVNLWGSYKINTPNKYEYKYGNKLALSIQPYYKIRAGKTFTVAPNTGILFEKAQKDNDGDLSVDISGGTLLLGSIGAEASVKRIFFGANFQVPLSQDLAMGIVKAGNRAMAHIAFAF